MEEQNDDDLNRISQPYSTYEIHYTHPVKQSFGPKEAIVDEKMDHYFLSEDRIMIRNECRNSGFMYSSSFYPISIIQLQERRDEEGAPLVEFQAFFKVHFVKKIPFIGGKIEKESAREAKEALGGPFISLIKEHLQNPKFVPRRVEPIKMPVSRET